MFDNYKRAFEEELAKQRAEMNARTQGLCGSRGETTDPAQSTLRDRIMQQRYDCEKRADRYAGLAELTNLLEKNPEVARILELMDQLQP